MSDTNSKIVTQWEELKVLVESIETDLLKNVSGNKSAGVRVRKALRILKTSASDIVKASLAHDKSE
jgi:hypothetical protein